MATDMLPQALRLLFKQEWDSRYKATYGEWKDTPQNGLDFKNGESPAHQRRNARLLATMVNGDRAQWDCNMLFYAILFSDSIRGLRPLIRTNVEDLRKFRNEYFAHMTGGQLSNADFSVTVAKVETAFRALGLSTAEIQAVSKQKRFPTDELHNVKTDNQKLTQELQTKDAELQEKKERLKTTEEQRKVFEGRLGQPFCLLPPRVPHVPHRDCDVAKVPQKLLNLRKASENDLICCFSGSPGFGKSQVAVMFVNKFYKEARKDTSAPVLRERKVQSFCVLPPRPPHVLACRVCDVAKVTQKLLNLRKASDNNLSCCYISGNPGSGKSQLAGLVAENFYKEARKDTSAPSFVMTLNAENLESLLASYSSLARKLSCPGYTITTAENSKDLNTEQKIAIIKDLISTKIHLYSPWLLVFDNVTNLARMGQFLPERGNGRWSKGQLLITTQDCSCIPPESPCTSHLSISKGMNDMDAADLLYELTGTTDHGMGKKVAHALGYQPLALASAGIFVRKVRNTNPDFGWEGYLEKLEKGKRERTEEELTRVNNIYLDSMTEATRIAAEAEIDSNEKMKHAFTNKTVPDHLEEATINFNMGIIYDHMDDYQQAKEYCKSALPIPLKKTGPTHALVVGTYQRTGNLHSELGDYQQEKESYERALSLQLSKLDPDHVNVANTYQRMGNLHSELGDHQQAQTFYERALSIQLSKLGPDHVNVANTYQRMGNLHSELGDHQQVKEFYERALSIQLSKLGPDHVNLANTYQHMGNLHSELGDHQQAKEFYERALSIQLSKLGPDHVNVANTYQRMGNLYSELGNHRQAKENYDRALYIQLSKLGPDHVDVANTYHNMANLHQALGDHQQAKENYDRALSIQLSKLGPDHVNVANTHQNMGKLHHKLGDYEKAKECYQRALSLKRNKRGFDHVEVTKLSRLLADVQRVLDSQQQAPDHHDRTQLNQPQKREPDQNDVKFAPRK